MGLGQQFPGRSECCAQQQYRNDAKPEAQQRQRGSYMLISGGVTGTPLSVVYVIDETTNELVALAWDDAGKKMSYVGYRNIAADSMQARRGGR